ncbi:hypothetical protein SLEP1_g19276 [Rubroshorea leprosula]|nr:hypothetical protein SLEP1_g19276 [Rubroshorea leprosula]
MKICRCLSRASRPFSLPKFPFCSPLASSNLPLSAVTIMGGFLKVLLSVLNRMMYQSFFLSTVSLEPVATIDPVEDISTGSGESNSGSSHTKSGDGSSPATKSVAADVSMIDDDLENELLAQLDMLMDPPVKSGSVVDSKGKAIAEKANPDIDLPTQEQISFTIMTLQELIDGDPSHFCKVLDQPAAFEAAQILSRAPQLFSTQQKF